jgi:DNA-binding SARP family transcriptional activator
MDQLLDTYTGRFALDFTYEEWATAYRDNLHAAVLGAAEDEIRARADAGLTDAAILLAQRVLLVDSNADAIELLLLRSYKHGGRLAAAAEQYVHYASVMRDQLGVDPPAIEDI